MLTSQINIQYTLVCLLEHKIVCQYKHTNDDSNKGTSVWI